MVKSVAWLVLSSILLKLCGYTILHVAVYFDADAKDGFINPRHPLTLGSPASFLMLAPGAVCTILIN